MYYVVDSIPAAGTGRQTCLPAAVQLLDGTVTNKPNTNPNPNTNNNPKIIKLVTEVHFHWPQMLNKYKQTKWLHLRRHEGKISERKKCFAL